jgi:hypothetical protein
MPERINKDQFIRARLARLNIAASVSISLLIPHGRLLAVEEGVPHFNIERTCWEARAYAGTDREVAYKGCLKDEADAHDQLVEKWMRFALRDRRDCIAQGAAPMPSYVELLTCLEMSADVETLDAPEGARGDLSAPAREGLAKPHVQNGMPTLPFGKDGPATKN